MEQLTNRNSEFQYSGYIQEKVRQALVEQKVQLIDDILKVKSPLITKEDRSSAVLHRPRNGDARTPRNERGG